MFRQGHELYIDEVKKQNIYPLSKKYFKSLPWNINPLLPVSGSFSNKCSCLIDNLCFVFLVCVPQTEVPVRVVGIKFDIKPPRLCSLKLAVTDWESGELTGTSINNVTYHDVSNIVDFLVLRQVYDKAMRHRWNVGDRYYTE